MQQVMARRRIMTLIAGLGLIAPLGAVTPNAQAHPSVASTLIVKGAGSTFVYPLMKKWIAAYSGTVDPGVQVSYQPIGSGYGIDLFLRGLTDFGATDAPLGDHQIKAAGGDVLHIPLTLAPEAIVYNLPGLRSNLKLDGPTLAQIYLGKITRWNDQAVATLNPGLTLPDQAIVVVHRSDGSGTTFIFSSYLSAVSADWRAAVGSAAYVNWPVGAAGNGNAGVASLVQQWIGGIGYVALSYAQSNHLVSALLKNRSGQFLAPSVAGAAADAANAGQMPADLRANIVDAPGPTSYPISGFSWALIHRKAPNLSTYSALLTFLWWCIHDGQQLSSAGNLRYAPLPATLVRLDEAKIRSVTYAGKPVYTG